MKKVLGLFLAVLAVFSLAACNEKEYKHDGEFTAFEVGTSYGNPQVTWVTVTIKDGKVASYYIDELQSGFAAATIETETVDGEEVEKAVNGEFAWNAKTKKELKDDYGMTVVPGTIQVEWYVQAKSIEDKWLADGVDSVEVDEDGYITNMPSEATMVGDVYNKLAKEALNKAKEGVATAFEVGVSNGNAQVTWVEAEFEKGEVVSYFIDELQSKVAAATIETETVDGEEVKTAVNGEFAWNEKTKKELKDDYGMTVVPGTIKVEWYVQAKSIEDKWLADGVDSVEVDEDGYITNMPSEATMVGDVYNKLAKEAASLVK